MSAVTRNPADMPVTAWFLDVDGPITDPAAKRVTDPRVIDEIVARLAAGEPVILNTGRGTPWVTERVIAPLRRRGGESGLDAGALLDRLLIVGEKGGTSLVHLPGGNAVVWRDRTLTVPAEIHAQISRLVAERFSATMFVDPAKETMISVEMRDGLAPERYAEAQAAFATEVRALLAAAGHGGVRVDETQIAVDIQHPGAGKARGAAVALRWLDDRGIAVERCVCVGDSASDIEMADATAAAGIPTEFVFVGPTVQLALLGRPYPVTVTVANNAAGTVTMFRDDRRRRHLSLPGPGREASGL